MFQLSGHDDEPGLSYSPHRWGRRISAAQITNIYASQVAEHAQYLR